MQQHVETPDRSAEYLRAALPLMTRQRTGLHPMSYAVWYEFVQGRNSALVHDVKALLAEGNTLTEAQTALLYRRHIAATPAAAAAPPTPTPTPPDEAQARLTASTEQLSDGMSRVLGDMAASAQQAGADTARFDASLTGWVEQLLGQSSAPTNQTALLHELVDGTREVRDAMRGLQQRLDASQSEIDKLRSDVQQARSDALLDALTGLANRRAFDQRLHDCVASHNRQDAGGEACCLLMGDIDFFKNVNDRYGHAFGDQVLRAVGKTLKSASSNKQGDSTALAARVGGEEFALILPGSNLAAAQQLAEQVRASVAGARIRRGEALADAAERITISLGVVQLGLGETATAFFERADRALYQSKRDGRNRVTALDAAAELHP